MAGANHERGGRTAARDADPHGTARLGGGARDLVPPACPAGGPARVLAAAEGQQILQTLNSPRFVDVTPYTAYAQLLDEGIYLGSVRTFYRVLCAAGELRERRNQLIHPPHTMPQLSATAPNQVWSWDISKLRSTLKWHFFYLYLLLDLYSRYVVGWLVAEAENAALAGALIEESCHKHGIARDTLTLHSDRGSPMRAKTTAELLVDLGVAASFSRPRVSNDNPFSEAQFKTLKPARLPAELRWHRARAHSFA